MGNKLSKYINFSFFNLCLVAIYGVVMRYKIGFEFPFFDQKSLQHAHSHFAFSGWISQTLILLIVNTVSKYLDASKISKYFNILNANLICAYGMLISFTMQGYGPVSIIFSTSSVLVSFIFAYFLIKDLKSIPNTFKGKNWFRSAVFFNIISSAGTMSLAYIMAAKDFHQDIYLSSVYFYLHFQYNGWFFFACMGLFINKIHEMVPSYNDDKLVFRLFAISCIPAFFLSTLWLKLPVWIYIITVISAFMQVIGWIIFIYKFKIHLKTILEKTSFLARYLFAFVALALTIKLTLQLFSTIPYISTLAFGFRTIVIAYLHLVLLAIISTFLLAYIHSFAIIKSSKLIVVSLIIFTIGIFLNELVLLIQGLASFSYTLIPYGNEILFGVSLVLLIGTLLLLSGKMSNKPN